MTPLLHPDLVNGRFGDPALYVECMFERWALLFDLGDIHALSARKLLRLRDVFVSHAHMDHFIGFDQLLRVLVGRDRTLRLYGPAGIIDRVEHRLAGYSWNLVDRYDTDLVFAVTEILSETEARHVVFRFRNRFRREEHRSRTLRDGRLRDHRGFGVRCAVLDHRIPCLAFAVEEDRHVNVWKNRLDELGLPVGPWLRDLKQAVLQDKPDDLPVRIEWRDGTGDRQRTVPLGELRERVLRIVPGQKIAYVTDVAPSAQNENRILDLARGADILFIEAPFAAADSARAADRAHLTTRAAGRIARRAGVRRVEPFHFSPRYAGEEDRLMAEVAAAFGGPLSPAG